MNGFLRKAVFAGAAITTGVLMTVCQNGTAASSFGRSGAGAAAVAEKASDAKVLIDHARGNDFGSASASASASASGETVIDGINKGNGVNGTWFGNVSYLAPGTYTVSDMKGVEQQFLISEDTKIWGYGDICGDTNTEEGGQGGTQCTEAELERAAQKGFTAEVVISNGIASTIRDDH
ncbi:hypothetical protein ACWCQK_27785 [Streptomyces sp. NPDC002306]